MADLRLKNVPRGNTCPGVNEIILEHILNVSGNDLALLDIPCGKGEFLDAVKDARPSTMTVGVDISVPSKGFRHAFVRADLSTNETLDLERRFEIVTCISGVMEFDNTRAFFEKLRPLIDVDGELIVTNDNLLSVRDRFSYALFGRFRQYRLRWSIGEPTWKVVTITNLLRVLADAGFEAREIKYVSPSAAEWLWLPIAIVIFGLQRLSNTGDGSLKILPFLSLFSRHYILFCRVKAGD